VGRIQAGLAKLPANSVAAKLVDWEIAAVDFRTEGLLMAPAFAIPRLLARAASRTATSISGKFTRHLRLSCCSTSRRSKMRAFVRNKAGVDARSRTVPRERVNPNGGSIALGHPFGATGARILSQAVKGIAERPSGQRCIVSICTDGGQGTVALLQSP
jgi:acetyl-CoA C-acetyltransferase